MPDLIRRMAGAASLALVLAGAILLILVASMDVYSAFMVSQFTPRTVVPATIPQPAGTHAEASPEGGAEAVVALHRERDAQGPPSGAADRFSIAPGPVFGAGEEQPAWRGLPAARIIIPRIGVDSRVIELRTKIENGMWVWETPANAVGHYAGTANPGEIGNVVLTGHISSPIRNEGSVFKRLPELGLGDLVELVDEEGWVFEYAVTEMRLVLPQDTGVLDPADEEVLTLITCFPDWTYTHRLVVKALPVPSASVPSP